MVAWMEWNWEEEEEEEEEEKRGENEVRGRAGINENDGRQTGESAY